MPFYIIKGDLVKMNVDAIVNAANYTLKMVEGVGRAIFHAAGDIELTNACKAIGKCAPGNAVSTPSFNLTTTKLIIHAVAPIYQNGKHDEELLLRRTYQNAFKIVKENNFKSVAFPLLGGEFNWPLRDCFNIACEEIKNYIKHNDLDLTVYLVMYKNYPSTVGDVVQEALTKFITTHYKVNEKERVLAKYKIEFPYTWKRFYNGMSDEELMYRANISSVTLNLIKNDPKFKPSKNLTLALAFGLGLKGNDMKAFLRDFNITLNYARLLDLILLFFIENDIYDVYEINNAMFIYDYPPLGERY
ncbi:MAG: macro domain-containing protein [Candidatus Onthovivens sp.]|nr:macro domain-containing protein [Candidatus Onthovivens sp.]